MRADRDDLQQLSDRELLVRIATTVESHGRVQDDHETRIRAGEVRLTEIQTQDRTRERDRRRGLGWFMAAIAGLNLASGWVFHLLLGK